MKQTNLFNSCLSLGRVGFAKPLGISMVCLAFLLIMGTQNATAQTMVELGEVKSANAINLIQDEIQFLEQEDKYPTGSTETDKNYLVVRYYRSVLDKFDDGADIKVALREIGATYDHRPSNVGTSISDANATVEETSVLDPNGADMRDLVTLILGLKLSDDDDSDLEAIFTFWRTLKNR